MGHLIITDSTFDSNNASRYGGALYSEPLDAGANTNVQITDTIFSNNSALDGGAILRQKGGMQIQRTLFQKNTAMETVDAPGGGGAIDNLAADMSPSGLQVTESSFVANKGISGGAILNTGAGAGGANLTMSNTAFIGNVATSTLNGGGAIVANAGIINIWKGGFTGNQAVNPTCLSTCKSSGGAIDLVNGVGQVTVNQSTFQQNAANNNGGALLNDLGASSTLAITGSTFNLNTAVSSSSSVASIGGALDLRVANTQILGSTFTANKAKNGSAIAFESNGSAAIENSTIANNTVPTITGTTVGGVLTNVNPVSASNTIIADGSIGNPRRSARN